MLHLPRDYENEILKILAKEGGCISGQRELGKKGNFHSTRLKAHLDNLIKLDLISAKPDGGKIRYCLNEFSFEDEYKKITKLLDDIEKQLHRPFLKKHEKLFLIQSYVRVALQKYHNQIVSLLYAESINDNSRRVETIKLSLERLRADILRMLKNVNVPTRTRIIDSMLNVIETPLKLEEYREKNYTPTKKELEEYQERLEKQNQEDYEKYQKFCQVCGKKNPPTYQEGRKHRQKHGEYLYAIIKHGGWHCPDCGKPIPLDPKKARKHRESHFR